MSETLIDVIRNNISRSDDPQESDWLQGIADVIAAQNAENLNSRFARAERYVNAVARVMGPSPSPAPPE